MIRKLKSGQSRLYSRKVDEKTGKRRNLGTFATRSAAVYGQAESVQELIPAMLAAFLDGNRAFARRRRGGAG